MVDFLHDEAEYWCKVASNEQMWSQKCKSTAAASRRHTQKRVRLSQYLPDSSSSADSHSEDEAEEDMQDVLTHSQARDVPPSLSPSLSLSSQEQNSTSRSKRICSNCVNSKLVNKDCSLGVCKDCCVVSTGRCKLTAHRCEKPTTSRPYLEPLAANKPASRTKDMLARAIEQKCSVYIAYRGGTHGDLPRKIDPKLFKAGKKGQLVESYCHTANAARSFCISDIMHIEEEDWSTPAAPSMDFALHTCVSANVHLRRTDCSLIRPTVSRMN
jgi:hypothetical protein